MRSTLIIFAAVLFGCGNSPGGNSDDAFASSVAEQFLADCKKAPAPNAKAASELDQLCSCTTNKLRLTVRTGDSDDVVTGKMRRAQQACLKDVYPNG